MGYNKKILKIGIGINIIVVLLGLIFITLCNLDKPVFLEHYYDYGIPIFEETEVTEPAYDQAIQFTLHYITNREDNNEVQGIFFHNYPELLVYASEQPSNWSINYTNIHMNSFNLNIENSENYHLYSIRTVYVTLYTSSISNTKEGIHLTQADVEFQNGEKIEVDIGDIYLYKYNHTKGLLDGVSSSSSSDGTSNETSRATDNITLTSIHSPLLDKLDGLIEFNINNHEYTQISGLEIKKGESLVIDTYTESSPETFYKIVDITPRLTYMDKNQKVYSKNIYDFSSPWPNMDFWSILKYLYKGGYLN
jgi:hypothetical protein